VVEGVDLDYRCACLLAKLVGIDLEEVKSMLAKPLEGIKVRACGGTISGGIIEAGVPMHRDVEPPSETVVRMESSTSHCSGAFGALTGGPSGVPLGLASVTTGVTFQSRDDLVVESGPIGPRPTICQFRLSPEASSTVCIRPKISCASVRK